MLKVENLVKHYKSGFFGQRVKVLNEVSFNVNQGEIFGYIGPNGAGKTTTFKAVLNFVSNSGGTITINGKPYTDSSVRSLIGYLPESPYFYDYLTGEELLKYMGDLHAVDKDVLNDRIDYLLDKVNMNYARKVQLRKYSKGMLQRIGVAQALINDPEFLILDEPMSGLDPIGRREIRDLILEKKEKGKTILLSSHILSDVESLCDRVGVIIDGVVVKVGTLSELYREIKSDYEMLLNCKRQEVESLVASNDVKITERAGFLVLRFDESEKKKIVNKVLESDIEMISLFPLRKSLEGIFEEQAKNI